MMLSAKFRVGADVVTKGLNRVWQVGGSVIKGVPQKHDMKDGNLNVRGVLDLVCGGTAPSSTGTGGASRTKRKNMRGILNVVSWGIMFPVGIIIARYWRTFLSADPAWFYLQVFCQFSAYAIRVAGWATGLKLGGETKGIAYSDHHNIGMALFLSQLCRSLPCCFDPRRTTSTDSPLPQLWLCNENAVQVKRYMKGTAWCLYKRCLACPLWCLTKGLVDSTDFLLRTTAQVNSSSRTAFPPRTEMTTM